MLITQAYDAMVGWSKSAACNRFVFFFETIVFISVIKFTKNDFNYVQLHLLLLLR